MYYGPFLAENTVTGVTYLGMLENYISSLGWKQIQITSNTSRLCPKSAISLCEFFNARLPHQIWIGRTEPNDSVSKVTGPYTVCDLEGGGVVKDTVYYPSPSNNIV